MMDSDVLFAFTAGIRICCKKKNCHCIDWADGEGNNSLSPLLVCTRSACSIVCSCGRQGCLYQQSNFTLHPSIFLSTPSPPISFDCKILSESSMCVCDYFLSLSSVLSLTLHCFSFFVSCYHSSHCKNHSHFLAHLYHSLISLFLPHSFIIYISLTHRHKQIITFLTLSLICCSLTFSISILLFYYLFLCLFLTLFFTGLLVRHTLSLTHHCSCSYLLHWHCSSLSHSLLNLSFSHHY